MSYFRAFDSNLPVLDVQIMGGGAGWRVAGGGQKKGNRGRDCCGKFKSSGKLGGEEGAPAHPVSSIRGGSASK